MHKTIFILVILAIIITTLDEVSGHGRLMVPPARNAMWREGFPNPVNYNDNELYCGGFVVHYQKNGGKCGVCGDNYRDEIPRNHEAGGLYGNGITGRRYIMGQVIEVTAELTTNHKGWMELKLCPNNEPNEIITQECLDEYPLQVVDSPYADGHRFVIPKDSPKVVTFSWKVKLPDGLTCSQCVFQWTYFAGNTWGQCINGTGSVGCGDQETFINCADVAIITQTTGVPDEGAIVNPWAIFKAVSGEELTDKSPPTNQLRPLVIRTQLCIPVGKYKKVPGMKDWCRKNCMKYISDCPPSACKCVHNCTAIGEFAEKPDADIFCLQNCLRHPSYCPEERCECF